MQQFRWWLLWPIAGLFGVYIHVAQPAKPSNAETWKYVNQGWSAAQRADFYWTPQGSYVIPYEWFLHLEQATNARPFRSSENIERLRYLKGPADANKNPDGLPVGFVKEVIDAGKPPPAAANIAPINPAAAIQVQSKRMDTELLRSFMGKRVRIEEIPRPKSAWLGFTCAACHTTQLECNGKQLRVDGAPALADFNGLMNGLAAAMQATLIENDKFDRFANNILGAGAAGLTKKALYKQLEDFFQAFSAYTDRNHPPFAHGFGRLDAFGLIMNETFGTALKVPANYRAVDAPVSYPDLWNAPALAWVQWNGSASNPFGRNVGEVFGVFGHIKVTTPSADGFASSVRGRNLFLLESLIAQLKPPVWAEEVLGKIDQAKAVRGAGIYKAVCASCHAEKPPYPMTAPNANGKQFIQVHMTKLNDIGTDPKMATNFVQRKALPGPLGQPTDPEMNALSLLTQVVFEVTKRQFKDLALTPQQQLEYSGFRAAGSPPDPLAYRAKPLAGVWATGPYLHNGSVPSLYQLLLPPGQRDRTFYVGSRVFDPVHVGFVAEKSPGSFFFDTGLPGNSNAGHAYGIDLTEGQRWELLEYLKSF